ncbi:MAG: hypothetical protein RR705_02985 [Lachnospiraceae bacterium]
MENSYKIFKKAMQNLENESNRKECEMLVFYAQRYYSHYQQELQLSKVAKRLANIYIIPVTSDPIDKLEIKLRKRKLDIRYRLFLEFYLNAFAKANSVGLEHTNWNDLINHCKTELEDNLPGLKNEKILRGSLDEWIMKSCESAKLVYTNKSNTDLGMDNIRKAVRRFNQYKDIKTISEEECFNAVFSEAYICTLINVMKNNETILCMYMTPIRSQLCKKAEGGRTINNKTWNWCYKQDFRLSLDEIEDKIQCLQGYKKICVHFEHISKELNKILKSIGN